MAEETKEEKPVDPEQEKRELADRVEKQKQLVAKMVGEAAEDDSAETRRRIDRERDILRHLRQTQKEKPKERAEAKATYAAKAALSRAIQPVADE